MRTITISDPAKVKQLQAGRLQLRQRVKDINPAYHPVAHHNSGGYLRWGYGSQTSSYEKFARLDKDEIIYIREPWAMAMISHKWIKDGEVVKENKFIGFKYRSDGEYMFPNGVDAYAEDDPNKPDVEECIQTTGWQPAVTMPKAAVRLFAVVLDDKFQQVRDMTEEDAIAEGWPDLGVDADSPLARYAEAWDKKLKRDELSYSWNENPWTEVIQIRPVTPFDPKPDIRGPRQWICG